MKNKRQERILELIREYEVETQKELVDLLNEQNYNVTQATVSRDIRDLCLVKVQTPAGAYRYAANPNMRKDDAEVLIKIFEQTVLSVESAGNLVVLKTLSGSAGAAAEMIDSLQYSGVMGTLAGDNTIFVAASSEQAAQGIAAQFSRMIGKKER